MKNKKNKLLGIITLSGVLLISGQYVSNIKADEVLVSEQTHEVVEPKEKTVINTRQREVMANIDTTDTYAEKANTLQDEYKSQREEEARKKAEAEEAERIRQAEEEERIRVENERIAEEKRQAEVARIAQVEKERVASASEETVSQNSNQAASEQPQQQRTDGFNFLGYHFGLSTFSGTGFVPAETPYVFQWTNRPSHYLVERISPAGRVIQQLGMGHQVVLNGKTYVVTNIKRTVPNNNNAYNVLTSIPADMTIQTCELTKGPNGKSDLTIWYLHAQ